jgi:hypothetical protein
MCPSFRRRAQLPTHPTINPSENQVPLHRDISIPLGAKEALMQITDALNLSTMLK